METRKTNTIELVETKVHRKEQTEQSTERGGNNQRTLLEVQGAVVIVNENENS